MHNVHCFILGAVQVLRNHLEAGRGQAKVLQLITIYRRELGVVYYNIIKICVECWLVSFKEAPKGKTIVISRFDEFHQIVFTVFS